MISARLLVDTSCQLGEGAWMDYKTRNLYWLDILGCEIHRTCVKTGEDFMWKTKKPVTTIVPCEEGGFVVGAIDGMYRMDENFSTMLPLPKPYDVNFHNHRCNDGKCDPQGRFWVGVMELDGKRGGGALYCIDNASCTLGWADLDVPNGIVWNGAQDKVFFTDTINSEIYAFDFQNGKLSNKRTIFTTDLGMTDGIAIDENDNIWVCVWGSGRVLCIDPATAEVLDYVSVPVPQVTSVAIANGHIYVTSANTGMSEKELHKYPHSGALFIADVPLTGVQSYKYRG